MKILKNSMLFALLALLLLPAAVMSQDEPEQKNVMEFGIRAITGDVRGRQDLQFRPDIITSKFNEYSDRRNGFYLRRADLLFDDLFGTSNFIELKSTSSVYRNQSYLVTYGRYGKFSVQFRYDEIPHIYTNTARTIYSETSPGNWQVPVGLKQALQTASSTGTAAAIGLSLPSFIVNQITCGPPIPPSTTPPACAASFVTPRILRKMGTGLLVTELIGQGVNYVTGDYSRGAAGFWVENGRIAHPVHEITIAGNLRDMFAGIQAVGADVYNYGAKTVGSVLVDRMKVAGS